MRVQYLGHACFKIIDGNASVVIDPYNDSVGYPPLNVTAGAVYKSHEHGDHNFLQAVTIEPDCGGIAVSTVATAHDEVGGAKRGDNLVHIFEAGGVRAVHLGDLGHALTDEQVCAIGRADVVMVPVGGFYTIDAAAAIDVCRSLKATTIIPMHYRGGWCEKEVLATVDDFLDMCDEHLIVHYADEVDIMRNTAPQVAVLTYGAACTS